MPLHDFFTSFVFYFLQFFTFGKKLRFLQSFEPLSSRLILEEKFRIGVLGAVRGSPETPKCALLNRIRSVLLGTIHPSNRGGDDLRCDVIEKVAFAPDSKCCQTRFSCSPATFETSS